jgi:hypothetical protein
MKIITAMVTGQLGKNEVGLSITALPDTPDEVRDVMIEQAKRTVEHRWPGVADVQQTGAWKELEVPDEEGPE